MQYIIVFQLYDSFQLRHICFVEFFPDGSSGKQDACFRMVDDVVDCVGSKFVEDGDGDSSVGQYGEKCNAPVGHVSATECNFVAFPDVSFFKEDM